MDDVVVVVVDVVVVVVVVVGGEFGEFGEFGELFRVLFGCSFARSLVCLLVCSFVR